MKLNQSLLSTAVLYGIFIYMFHYFFTQREKASMLKNVVVWAQKRKVEKPALGGIFFYSENEEGCIEYRNNSSGIDILLIKKATLSEALSATVFLSEKEHDWYLVAEDDSYAVWEKIISTDRKKLPLRFGIDQDEMKELCAFSRHQLEYYFDSSYAEEKEKNSLFEKERYTEMSYVSVTIWVSGQMRGTSIKKGDTFLDAISKATLQAVNDLQYKPLTKEELPRVRLEITYLSNLFLPYRERTYTLSQRVYVRPSLLERKWAFPYLSNSSLHKNASTFVKQTQGFSKKSLFHVSAISFIESENTHSVFVLNGPILQKEERSFSCMSDLIIDGIFLYLKNNQDKDGYITSIHSVLSSEKKSEEWHLTTLFVYALIKFSKSVQSLTLQEEIEKAYVYIKKVCFSFDDINVDVILYLLKVAFLVQDREMMAQCESFISQRFEKNKQRAVFLFQYSFFLLEEKKETLPHFIVKLLIVQYEEWKKKVIKKEDFELAYYADLIPLFILLGKTEDSSVDYSEKAKEMLLFYQALQKYDGSFPVMRYGSYSHIRGTGKIVESLSRSELLNNDNIFFQKSLRWIFNMQYDKENTFFVKGEEKLFCMGGFRHDVYTTDIWIDSLAHVLLFLTFSRNNYRE